VTQLFVDEIQLINALELVEWDQEHSQFLICEACGFEGCKSRDWVSVRRSDSLVLFLPSSEHVWREKKDYMEYCPPAYLNQRGIPYLESANYAAGFTEWQAIVFDGSEYRLLVESKFVVDPVS